MTSHRAHIAEALQALVIRSRLRFGWLGEPSPPVPRALASVLPASAARALLVARVGGRLYESFYSTGGVVTIGESAAQDRWPPDPTLVAALSAANAGRGPWERGWRAEGVDEDRLIVARDGIRVRVRRSECRPWLAAQRIGTEVSVALPPELPALSPGFFTVLGDVDLRSAASDLIVRLYFNVSHAGAVGLVAQLTATLNRARVPFRLKVVDHPLRFGRCDAAVLYVGADAIRGRARLFRRLMDAASGWLEPRTPVFTRQVAPGVGLGEERGDAAESFGMRRCGLLAEGLVDAHERRIRDVEGRLRVVEHHFVEAGIDLDAPHLEEGSVDDYFP